MKNVLTALSCLAGRGVRMPPAGGVSRGDIHAWIPPGNRASRGRIDRLLPVLAAGSASALAGTPIPLQPPASYPCPEAPCRLRPA